MSSYFFRELSDDDDDSGGNIIKDNLNSWSGEKIGFFFFRNVLILFIIGMICVNDIKYVVLFFYK